MRQTHLCKNKKNMKINLRYSYFDSLKQRLKFRLQDKAEKAMERQIISIMFPSQIMLF